MVLIQENVVWPLQVGHEVQSLMSSSTGILFTSEGRMKQEIERGIPVAFPSMIIDCGRCSKEQDCRYTWLK